MSTQIQQQQVQGLLQAVADLSTISGNLVTTGTTLATNLAGTGFAVDSRITALSGDLVSTGSALDVNIASNTASIVATGSSLSNLIGNITGDLSTTGSTLSAAIEATGKTNFDRLTQSGTIISGNLVTTGAHLLGSITSVSGGLSGTGVSVYFISGNLDYTSGKLDIVSGALDYTSGKLDTATGDLIITGSGLGDRLGENADHSSNFGLPTGLSVQLFGESYNIPNYSCGTRQLQWIGDLQGGVSSEIFLGGVFEKTAHMPYKGSWAVKMVGHAKSMEPGDQRSAQKTGVFMLETGFVIDHEQSAPHVQFTGINGSSGYMGSGIHYGITVGPSGTSVGCLSVTGHNNYTGTVRFHVTAEVSEMTTFPSGAVYLST